MTEFVDPEVLQAASRARTWSADIVTMTSQVRTHPGQMMTATMIMADGFVLETSVEPAPPPEPENVSNLLERGLRKVAERVGSWPDSVVVRHGEVAGHLGPRLSYLGVEVLHSPILPDIEEATRGLRSYMGADRHPQIHFGPALWRGWHRPDAWTEDFFHAAALYYEAAPWLRRPPGTMLAVEGTSGRTWYVLPEGDGDADDPVAPVLSLFSNRSDAEVAVMGPDEEALHFEGRGLIVLFVDRSQLPPEAVQEVNQAGWPVASPEAWPALLMINTPAGGLTAGDAGDLLAVLNIVPEAVTIFTPGRGEGHDGEWRHPESGLGVRLLPVRQVVGEDLFVDAVDRPDISPMVTQIRRRVEAEGATSIEDVRRIAAEENLAYNNTPQEELGGLTPEQANRLLNLSWESPEHPLRFSTNLPLDELETSPMLRRSRILLNTMLERGGINPTQAGNLPRAFVYEMMAAMGEPLPGSDRGGSVTRGYNEGDTRLYDLRTFLEFAGCIRRYRRKFIVARPFRPMLEPERAGELLRHLFIKHFHGMDLSCLDYFPQAPLFQFGLAFALWKFRDLSEEWLLPEEFIDRLILPTIRGNLRREVEDDDELRCIITFRIMEPLEKFGLAESLAAPDQDGRFPWMRQYRPTPLAARFLHFDFDQPAVSGARSHD